MAKGNPVAVEISPEVFEAIQKRASNCFLCRWIIEDLLGNGKMTGYPFDYNGQPEFPVTGKVKHLQLEGFISVELKT